MMDPVYVRSPVFQSNLSQIGQYELGLLSGVGEKDGLFIQRHTIQIFKMFLVSGIQSTVVSGSFSFEPLYQQTNLLPACFSGPFRNSARS